MLLATPVLQPKPPLPFGLAPSCPLLPGVTLPHRTPPVLSLADRGAGVLTAQPLSLCLSLLPRLLLSQVPRGSDFWKCYPLSGSLSHNLPAAWLQRSIPVSIHPVPFPKTRFPLQIYREASARLVSLTLLVFTAAIIGGFVGYIIAFHLVIPFDSTLINSQQSCEA